MPARNVEIVRSLFEAQARGDLEAIEAIYSPDVEWEDVSGLWGDWGVRRGREGVREGFATLFAAFEDVTFDAEEYLDAGDHVVVTTRMRGRGRGSGIAVEQSIGLVYSLERGRVTRIAAYHDRAEAMAAMGL